MRFFAQQLLLNRFYAQIAPEARKMLHFYVLRTHSMTDIIRSKRQDTDINIFSFHKCLHPRFQSIVFAVMKAISRNLQFTCAFLKLD